MSTLPDISDLVQQRKEAHDSLDDLKGKIAEKENEITQVNKVIVQRYKALGVKAENCDHPVVRYAGMGENYCQCCDTCVR